MLFRNFKHFTMSIKITPLKHIVQVYNVASCGLNFVKVLEKYMLPLTKFLRFL